MKKMIKKIFVFGIIPLGLIIGIDELVYIFPEPFFDYHKSYKQFEFYSTEKLPQNIDHILDLVERKIQISEYYSPDKKHRIYYCPTGTTYRKLMFNINERYIYNSTIRHNILIFADTDFDANNLFDKVFQVTYKADQCIVSGIVLTFIKGGQPNWMTNGYQEYISNYGDGYVDSGFIKNVRTFYSDSTSARLINEYGISRPRNYHRSRILIEYLILVKGMKLDEIKLENLTEDEVLKKLTAWYSEQ